jgi:hypothetical protein
MTTIRQKLKTFAKRDLLDVLLLCLCFAVGWYAYDRSNICASSAKQYIQDITEIPKKVGIDVNESEVKKGHCPLLSLFSPLNIL